MEWGRRGRVGIDRSGEVGWGEIRDRWEVECGGRGRDWG